MLFFLLVTIVVLPIVYKSLISSPPAHMQLYSLVLDMLTSGFLGDQLYFLHSVSKQYSPFVFTD